MGNMNYIKERMDIPYVFLRNTYSSIQKEGYFGIVHRHYFGPSDLEIIMSRIKSGGLDLSSSSAGFCHNKRMYVKKLRRDEMDSMPPLRFLNNFKLTYKRALSSFDYPSVYGVLYLGSPLDFFTNEHQGYLITKYIPGNTLHFEELTPKQRRGFFEGLRTHLSSWNEMDVYPLDFAPRDFVVTEMKEHTVKGSFVDTEHVLYYAPVGYPQENQKNQLRREQIKEFRREYKLFLTKNELAEAEQIVFPNLKESL